MGAGNLQFSGGKQDRSRRDITGSVDEKKEEKSREDKPREDKKEEKSKEEAAKPAVAPPEVAKPEGAAVIPAQGQPMSPSERAILERLQSRRQELEARAREIDIRESLLKSAEKRIESKVEEMKAVESRISAVSEQKAEADAAHFKGIITMYENMKPKDAAKVFDRLEMPVLYRNRLADRAAQDVRHPRPDVDRSGRAADHRNGPPRQPGQVRLRRRSSENRRQDAAAKAQLTRITNTWRDIKA